MSRILHSFIEHKFVSTEDEKKTIFFIISFEEGQENSFAFVRGHFFVRYFCFWWYQTRRAIPLSDKVAALRDAHTYRSSKRVV